jgi:NAD(P)-dependent dehydrogenase (short-subunit alcohol dehydrogenase family)
MNMKELDLSGQRILITGGAGAGIGSGICAALHHFGAKIVINDIDDRRLTQAAEAYPDALTVNADLKDESEVHNMFDQIRAFCGGVNGLVNNAGIGLSKLAHETTEQEFAHLYDVDVRAVWRLSKIFINECLGRGETGNIVNISSVQAHSTQSRYALYSSAKNAIIGLTRGMAVEMGPLGFRVNAVGPGYVHADQNYDLIRTWNDDPKQWVSDLVENHQVLNYDIRPLDIGNPVAFLLSDLARCITGQNIYVDNGTTSLIFNRDFT